MEHISMVEDLQVNYAQSFTVKYDTILVGYSAI